MLNAVQILHEHEVKSVFDIGCGRGILLKELKEHGFHVCGTEISEHLLTHDLKAIDVYPYAIHELKHVAEKSVDFAFSVNVLDHITNVDLKNTIRHCKRLARKGFGHIVNGDPVMKITHEAASWWAKRLKKYGVVERVERAKGGLRILVWLEES
jgi:2-polyprenyl-3-methyl-5-hydroxy-6-metoxy-1,4-benzoquinol methylase